MADYVFTPPLLLVPHTTIRTLHKAAEYVPSRTEVRRPRRDWVSCRRLLPHASLTSSGLQRRGSDRGPKQRACCLAGNSPRQKQHPGCRWQRRQPGCQKGRAFSSDSMGY
jgi:hypothetical protein